MSLGMSVSKRRISTKSEVIWRMDGRDEVEVCREEVENVEGVKEWIPINLPVDRRS